MQLPPLDFALAAGKHQTNYFHLWSAICKYSYYVLTKFDKGEVRPVKNTFIFIWKGPLEVFLILFILNTNHVTLIQEKFDLLQINLFQQTDINPPRITSKQSWCHCYISSVLVCSVFQPGLWLSGLTCLVLHKNVYEIFLACLLKKHDLYLKRREFLLSW